MTNEVQLALIAAVVTLVAGIPAALAAIGGFLVLLQKLKSMGNEITTINKQTNGNLEEAKSKNEQAERIMRGVTGSFPPGAEIKATLSVNDVRNNDDPTVIHTITKIEENK